LNADVHNASIHTQRRQTVDPDIGNIGPVFAKSIGGNDVAL
jgi:hypothetical protein